ncbi:MAG: hypothetical protein ACLUD0_18175 [Eubacterium ramulus]
MESVFQRWPVSSLPSAALRIGHTSEKLRRQSLAREAASIAVDKRREAVVASFLSLSTFTLRNFVSQNSGRREKRLLLLQLPEV